MHYTRLRRQGDVGSVGARYRPAGPCAVAGCDVPRRKGEYCGRHFMAAKRHDGDPLGAAHEWSPKAPACAECGAAEIAAGMRLYCSTACKQAAHRRGKNLGPQPPEQCAGCGADIRPYRRNGKASHRASVRFCDTCLPVFKVRRSYRLAVRILAHYQGTKCGICGEPIDMELRFPDGRSASLDHIVPLSLGGTDAVENLQLAHFGCNASKHGRMV
jgi:5-methylcytosine-specific restriction endonuclease McrA